LPSASPEEDVLVAFLALVSEVVLAGALEAVEAGAFPAVEAGLAGMFIKSWEVKGEVLRVLWGGGRRRRMIESRRYAPELYTSRLCNLT